jgi:hypothetical protein
MLAIAADFHHMRLLRLFAILATVFAVFFRRAIAGRMRAFVFIFCHGLLLLVGLIFTERDPKTHRLRGQGRNKARSRRFA